MSGTCGCSIETNCRVAAMFVARAGGACADLPPDMAISMLTQVFPALELLCPCRPPYAGRPRRPLRGVERPAPNVRPEPAKAWVVGALPMSTDTFLFFLFH